MSDATQPEGGGPRVASVCVRNKALRAARHSRVFLQRGSLNLYVRPFICATL